MLFAYVNHTDGNGRRGGGNYGQGGPNRHGRGGGIFFPIEHNACSNSIILSHNSSLFLIFLQTTIGNVKETTIAMAVITQEETQIMSLGETLIMT